MKRTITPLISKQWLRKAFLASALFGLLSGCNEEEIKIDYATEGAQWKTVIADAFEHNKTISNHRFSGTLNVASDSTSEVSAEGSLLPAMTNGISWHGVAAGNPLRLEAEVTFGSKEPDKIMKMPMLVQDNKLYVFIPMLNTTDEYLEIPIDPSGQTDSFSIDPFMKAGAALDDLTAYIVTEIPPEWVRTTQSPDAAAESVASSSVTDSATTTSEQKFIITVTEENRDQILLAVRDGWSAWVNSFPTKLGAWPALLPAEAAEPLSEGSSIEVTVNSEGYVTEQRIALSVDPIEHSTAPEEKLSYTVTISEVNQAPEMKMQVPKNVLSIEHVLAFLKAGEPTP